MRCTFCGWNNKPCRQTCEKCNRPLGAPQKIDQGDYDHTVAMAPVNETIHDFRGLQPTHQQQKVHTNEENMQNNHAEEHLTIRPIHRKNISKDCFCLQPLNDDGQPNGEVIKFEGDEVVLNRSNTIPQNYTITSKKQALITCSNGKFYIEDKSSQMTTFLQLSKPTEINDGDVILLGDQLFRFML